MIETKEVQRIFGSMEVFELFRLEWIRTCAKLNKKSENASLVPSAERRAEILGLKKKEN